jgi:hypothetical protein
LPWITKHGDNSTESRHGESRLPEAGGNLPHGLSEITIVAPITSTVRFPLDPVHDLPARGPECRPFPHLGGPMTLVQRPGRVDSETLERVDEAIGIGLGLVRLE